MYYATLYVQFLSRTIKSFTAGIHRPDASMRAPRPGAGKRRETWNALSRHLHVFPFLSLFGIGGDNAQSGGCGLFHRSGMTSMIEYVEEGSMM